jgi:hypothetical protein
MTIALPSSWAAISVGASVSLSDGRRALVTGVGRTLGRFREVALDGAPARIVDAGAPITVLFDEESKALATLIRTFPRLAVISRGVSA